MAEQQENAAAAEAVLIDGTEFVASLLFEPADWAITLYGCSQGDCSVLALGFMVLPFASGRWGKYADDLIVNVIPARSIYWSQEGATWATRNGDDLWLPLDDLSHDMAQGWRGEPLRVLEIDGKLVSLDTRRLTSAKLLGIDVPATISYGHTLDDLISVYHRDGIFSQIPIRNNGQTGLVIDMAGGLIK